MIRPGSQTLKRKLSPVAKEPANEVGLWSMFPSPSPGYLCFSLGGDQREQRLKRQASVMLSIHRDDTQRWYT